MSIAIFWAIILTAAWLLCGIAAAAELTHRDLRDGAIFTAADLIKMCFSILFLAQLVIIVEAVESVLERLDKIKIWGGK